MTVTPPPETISVTSMKLHCDGGDGALGHPRVYLTISKDGFVDCPYCDRHFVLAAGTIHSSSH